MSRWQDVVDAAPEEAARVRAMFERGKHKTMATLRRDGSPRISGMECQFDGGELTFGMSTDSVKARDLLRDGRLALHSPNAEPPEGDPASWAGEAKIAGTAVELPREAGDDQVVSFRVDVGEVVMTALDPTATWLVIESWHPGRGWETRRRR